MKIGILGRGTMANGISQMFAEKGYETLVWVRDIDEKTPRVSISSIEKILKRSVEKEKISKEDMDKTLNNISLTTAYDDLKDCDLIIEAIAEEMELKKDVFEKLDKICKESTILATNTSSLSITEIAFATKRPDKVIGMHFFNPVAFMKLVEVTKGIATSDETKDIIMELSKEVGKTPVEVEEAPGFIVNRILVPLINEGIGIFAEGIAKADRKSVV